MDIHGVGGFSLFFEAVSAWVVAAQTIRCHLGGQRTRAILSCIQIRSTLKDETVLRSVSQTSPERKGPYRRVPESSRPHEWIQPCRYPHTAPICLQRGEIIPSKAFQHSTYALHDEKMLIVLDGTDVEEKGVVFYATDDCGFPGSHQALQAVGGESIHSNAHRTTW